MTDPVVTIEREGDTWTVRDGDRYALFEGDLTPDHARTIGRMLGRAALDEFGWGWPPLPYRIEPDMHDRLVVWHDAADRVYESYGRAAMKALSD